MMKLLLFLLSVFFFNSVVCQENELITFDPDKEYTQEYIDSLINNKVSLDIEEYKKILSSDKSLNGWVYYYDELSSRFRAKKEYDSALHYYKKGIDYYEEAKIKTAIDGEAAIRLYRKKGNELRYRKNHSASIQDYLRAIDLNKKYSYDSKAYLFTGLAANYYTIGSDSLSLKYYLLASQDSIYRNQQASYLSTLSRIGRLYERLKLKDSATTYYREALKLSNNNSKLKRSLPQLNAAIGNLHFENMDIDSTYTYYKESLLAMDKFGAGPTHEIYFNFFKSFTDVYEGRYDKAEVFLKRLIRDSKTHAEVTEDDKYLMLQAYKLLALIYEKQGDFKKYQSLLNDSFNYLDNFHEMQLKEDLHNLEVEYQTKEKDASIAQLQKSQQQQEKIISQQKTIAFGLGGLLLLLSGCGYLFWRQRKLKNQYEKENLEQRLLRSQMNPHFVSNALNTVCALVDKKSDQTIPYVNKLAGLFRLTLNNSREEFVSLNEELAALRNYLELQSNLSQDFDFNINVDESIDGNNTIVPPMLMQPFVENAIIHGLTGSKNRGEVEIKISMNKQEGLLQCSISDNGVGYGNTSVDLKKHKSVSGDIVRERLAILKKKFKVNTRFNITQNEKNGARVELFVPYLLD